MIVSIFVVFETKENAHNKLCRFPFALSVTCQCDCKSTFNLSVSLTGPCTQETSCLYFFCSFKNILCIWVHAYMVYVEWGWGGDNKTIQPLGAPGENLRIAWERKFPKKAGATYIPTEQQSQQLR